MLSKSWCLIVVISVQWSIVSGLWTGRLNVRNLENSNATKSVLKQFDHSAVKYIKMKNISGTKWCGPGATARNYNDLGEHLAEDLCCRAHDHCDHIKSGEAKFGLVNVNPYDV
jgi:hypothetical protein